MFSQSSQGRQALSQLVGQGYSQQQATGMLQAALPAAAQAMHRASPTGQQGVGWTDVGSSNYAQNFLVGAVSGLMRGDGVMGAAVDGMQGVVGGHVAQVIASRFGLPSRVAGAVGAVATPWMIDFLWEKVRGGNLDLGQMFGGTAGAGQPSQGFGASQPSAPGGGLLGGLGGMAGMGGIGAALGSVFGGQNAGQSALGSVFGSSNPVAQIGDMFGSPQQWVVPGAKK